MATNASLGSDAQPTKDDRPTRGRDGCEATHDDGSTESDNNPPDHGVPTHGPARFLWECPKSTPVSELGDRYRRWQKQRNVTQTTLSETGGDR